MEESKGPLAAMDSVTPSAHEDRNVQVAGTLFRLLKIAATKVREASSQIVFDNRVIARQKVTNFEYRDGGENQGNLSILSRFVHEERRTWNREHFKSFFDNAITSLPEFVEAIESVCTTYDIPEARSRTAVSQFLEASLSQTNLPDLEEHFVDAVMIFLRDLVNSPTAWNVTVWLAGIWLGEEEYRLNQKITLRRPRASDFEEAFDASVVQYGFADLFRDHPSAILNFTVRSASLRQVQAEIECIEELFRLFRLGSVRQVRCTFPGETFLRGTLASGTTLGNTKHSTVYKYRFASQDVQTFDAFLARMRPLVVALLSRLEEAIDPIVVGRQRYLDALLVGGSIENRIALGISCMEALFLKAKERSELSHRLSQRAAALLRNFGVQPSKAYRELVRAYDIRSTFIHGSPISPEDRATAGELATTVLNYARMSLVSFMQTAEYMEKDQLIGKLDSSLLEENTRSKLADSLKNLIVPTD